MHVRIVWVLVLGLLMGVVDSYANTVLDSFPIPKSTAKQLFYLQRTTNSNTIICDLNTDSKRQLIKDNPVHVY